MKLRILSTADVRRALPMAAAIEGMKQAFAQLSAGRVELPLRSRVDVAAVQGVSLFMPAFLPQDEALAVKIVSVFPQNARRDIPTIHAVVLALDPETGIPLALLEGATLTAIRTGAGSGAATDLLARPEATVAAIIGSGVQARTQLEAVCTVRAIREVRVYSLNKEHAAAFAAELSGQGPIPENISVSKSAEAAVRGADIVCTATTARRPVFPGSALQRGAHVNAIGSFTPEMQEVDVETIRKSRVVVDSREAVLAEAGDLLAPMRQGLIDESVISAELGEILAGQRPSRQNPEQITYFKSVGVAVQDAVAARIALEAAAAQGLGSIVQL